MCHRVTLSDMVANLELLAVTSDNSLNSLSWTSCSLARNSIVHVSVMLEVSVPPIKRSMRIAFRF